MHLEKEFSVKRPRADSARIAARDETLLGLFPDTRTEIVEREGNRRTTESHYTALGRAGVATFHFTFRDDGDVLGLAGIASPAKDIPPRFSCWYPLLPYSPEYVAMKTARAIGPEVAFIDLPQHGEIAAKLAAHRARLERTRE